MNHVLLLVCTQPIAASYWADKLRPLYPNVTTCTTTLDDVARLVTDLQPALLLTEATFNQNQGFYLAQQAMISCPPLRCAVFMAPKTRFWPAALTVDVSGYLVDPNTDPNEVVHCLSEITQRRRYVSPALRQTALLPSPDAVAAVQKLKPRQRQIARLLVTGKTARQIALELGLQESTVRKHKENIVEALGLQSAYELKGFLGSVLGMLD